MEVPEGKGMKQEEFSDETLESYVLGLLPVEQARAIEARRVNDPGFQERIGRMEDAVVKWAIASARDPREEMRKRLLEQLEADLAHERDSGRPPVMHDRSTPEDFLPWTGKPEMVRPTDAELFHLIPLDLAEDRQTGLVWLKTGQPEEVHVDCVERIMILEGTCDVHIGVMVASLVPGDVITIPMHVPHHVRVTSEVWCKAIVQRVAA